MVGTAERDTKARVLEGNKMVDKPSRAEFMKTSYKC